MALDGMTFQHSYYGKEDYSSIYADDEPPFYDLQASLSFLDNQTQNCDSTFLQEGNYGNTTTFLHQPPHEILINEEKSTPSCDMSFNRDMEKKHEVTRRRTRVKKNNEENNNQRMTHIVVERNRRKQMNEYLSVLRSLMPDSYVQRCHQASIVGGAINFIRELEHRLHPQNLNGGSNENSLPGGSISSATPFSDTFNLPQFSMGSSSVSESTIMVNALADIEVSLVESHANIKIRSRRKPRLLLNLVSGLQSLGFIILHLNVSTVSEFVLYCFSTKMEDCCKLTSVAYIATAVYEMFKIHYDS